MKRTTELLEMVASELAKIRPRLTEPELQIVMDHVCMLLGMIAARMAYAPMDFTIGGRPPAAIALTTLRTELDYEFTNAHVSEGAVVPPDGAGWRVAHMTDIRDDENCDRWVTLLWERERQESHDRKNEAVDAEARAALQRVNKI